MRGHKTKIIIAVVVVAALASAWMLGTMNAPNDPISPAIAAAEHPTAVNEPTAPETAPASAPVAETNPVVYPEPEPELEYELETEPEYDPEPEIETEPERETEPDPEPVEYIPAPVTPVEPEDMVVGDESFTVTLSVNVNMLLSNMHLLHQDKHELVPADGWIFPPTEVTVYEGESVFNVLQREMRRHRIHMASRFTPVFNSAYVEAINNLYEFDGGPLSGWMYSVNGWFPNFGSSRYLLTPGAVIEWHFTVDLGRDLGVDWIAGSQLDD